MEVRCIGSGEAIGTGMPEGMLTKRVSELGVSRDVGKGLLKKTVGQTYLSSDSDRRKEHTLYRMSRAVALVLDDLPNHPLHQSTARV